MKLKEQLASHYILNELDPSLIVEVAPDDLHALSFLAGFEKAKELALILHKSKQVKDCFTDSQDFLLIGEEDV